MAPTALELLPCTVPPRQCDGLDAQIRGHTHTGRPRATAGLSLLHAAMAADLRTLDEHPANWCPTCMRVLLKGHHGTCAWARQVALSLAYIAAETVNQLHLQQFPNENEDQRQAYQNAVLDRVLANLSGGKFADPDKWNDGYNPTTLTASLKAYLDRDGNRAATNPDFYVQDDAQDPDTGHRTLRTSNPQATTEKSANRDPLDAASSHGRSAHDSHDTPGLSPTDDFYLTRATDYERAAHNAEQLALSALEDKPQIDTRGTTPGDILEIALSMFHQARARGTKNSKNKVYGPEPFSQRAVARYVALLTGGGSENVDPVKTALEEHILPALDDLTADESLPQLERAYLSTFAHYLRGTTPVVPVPGKDTATATDYRQAITENTDLYRNALRNDSGNPS